MVIVEAENAKGSLLPRAGPFDSDQHLLLDCLFQHCPRDIIVEVHNRGADVIERLIKHLDPRRIPFGESCTERKVWRRADPDCHHKHATKWSWSRVKLAKQEMDGTWLLRVCSETFSRSLVWWNQENAEVPKAQIAFEYTSIVTAQTHPWSIGTTDRAFKAGKMLR